jgi:Kef-type K+ transport system membrane component KefB/mannitol/fructose-specific phosphotransferase system IIA component (Ntr-type)
VRTGTVQPCSRAVPESPPLMPLYSSWSLPVTDPVLIVALAMLIFLVAPLLSERISVPGLVGLILAGAIVGPFGVGLLDRDPTIVLLGTVGLLYLVFLAGLELDLHRFARYRSQSIVFGLISFGLPMVLGTLVMPLLGFGWAASLLIGSIIGSHTLLAYPIVSRLGLVKNAAVTTVVGGTLVTDSLALAVLAVVAGAADGNVTVGFLLRLFGILALYVALVVVLVPRLGRWFFRNMPGQPATEFIFLMVVLFAAAWLASLAGAQPIIGAFMAGLALNRLIPNEGPLMNRVRFVGNALFVPFFLISVGMLVDPRVLMESGRVWVLATALVVLVNVGKYGAAYISQRVFDYTPEERMLIFGLSVPQAAATLAVTFVGLEVGLFDEAVVNAVIVMILATGLVGPWLVEKFGRQIALHEEQSPYDPGDSPQRILIPMANPATAQDLMDLALMIREPSSSEPLYPVTVVPADEERSGEFVTMAEKMLSHAVAYGAGADVPVMPLTRVDHNFANGIARGIAETRTSTVIIGWDGKRSQRLGVFGSVLDQLLEQTKQEILVAKLGHPLNTTERVLVLIPQGTDHLLGYLDSVRTIKLLANRLGASIHGFTIGAPAQLYADQFESVKPESPLRIDFTGGWGELLGKLQAEVRANDLVVAMSARRGAVSWGPALERLPGRLAKLLPESFVMLYPSEIVPSVRSFPSDAILPRALSPGRVLFGVEGKSYREVLHDLLEAEFGADRRRLDRIEEAVSRSAEAFGAEVRSGVVVPHARLPDLAQALAFLAISPTGVSFPNVEEPARLIFVLLTPNDQPAAHLSHLAEIASLVSDPNRLGTLLQARSVDDLVQVARVE